MPLERWLPVVGRPGYEVSDAGRVRSARGILKPLMGAAYPRVCLARKHVAIHQLVMAAFIGPALGRQVNHRDGAKGNPNLENLEYCSGSENMKHAFRTGLQSNRGEKHSRARLTDARVFEVRALLARGYRQREVGDLMNVSQSAISRVKTGARWSHLSAPVAVGA